MSYPANSSSDTATALKRLQQKVSSLADDVDDLQTEQRRLSGRIRDVDDHADELDSGLEQVRDAQGELRTAVRDDLDAIAATVRDLASSMGWMERRLRADHDLTPAPLDGTDDTLRQLAARARRGNESESVLLTPAQRAAEQREITGLDNALKRITQNTELALQHSATLAATAMGTPGHASAAVAFRTAVATIEGTQQQLPRLRKDAADARRKLEQDDEHREVHGPQVMTGTSARAQLAARLRARLDTAVADGALLPTWLVFAVGHQPVAEDVDAWMQLATELLAYRVTYEVTDPTVALGPGTHDDPRREAWRTELDEQLQARRRWPLRQSRR
ncbi:hypothetical protein [Actinoplanes subglobosus]|uniref:Uncharacterized protein n=1 Tax=Actinoplanes subglobosus TaxID=1547892 RepID=A0ABV8IV48_9ACTN